MADAREGLTLHATAVSVGGNAALIRGASGAGKSALALQLIALGGALVSDDRSVLWREGAQLIVDAPGPIRGQIEARGIGILNAPAGGATPLALIVDLDAAAPPRLPERETETILDVALPVMRAVAAAHFPAAVYLYLLHGRAA
ncbi:serine kinase [Pelagivirga sediminicola]|uniref:Serine kinase n=1 Tax=Pelagivirga sediminicola TaxID=2170575 RepID=A0A2T7G4S3_9RHOB|nr:HPr kinase/phosphatase C-terminal domain-containing protein [Pelagivirga sediminicola]PVA09428.1 serine kinase [Pelagivirga sediminicola]